MWILNNLKTLAAVLATATLSYALHALAAGWAENRHEAAMANQARLYVQQCEADKRKTREANDAIQKDAHDVAARLAAYKRLHPAACVVPKHQQAEPTPGGTGHAGSYGAVAGTTDAFREFAAECETYRRQRVVLEGMFE